MSEEFPEGDNIEDLNQEPEITDSFTREYPEFDKEKAQQLRDEYDKNLFGARVLSSVNFENSHQNIVQNSFNRARNRGDTIEGERPNIRRNYAYLDRLEKLVEKHGDNAIQRLCRVSATKLIVKPEDIPDKYWERENERSIERGDGNLTDEAKEEKTENIRERQKRSVEKWSNYLGDENSPFPLWFKAYTFDGISKMGRYDGDKEVFLKRRKGDTASYPNLNEAALSQTYQAIVAENGNDPDVEQLVKNGNFNKLYSKFYTEQNYKFEKIRIPEKAEDVHGKWVEYGIDQMNELFAASSLNGYWCIGQDYGALEGYFSAGQYVPYDERMDTQEKLDSDLNNKSKFILFHPTSAEDSETLGVPVVSIRLNKNGEVAEISGIAEDECGAQILNDSLVSEVKQKVLSLPGGEKYEKAFKQREQLISIFNKLNNEEEVTGDDLSFLWNPEGDYYPIGEYEDFGESSKLLDAKEKTKHLFAENINPRGGDSGAAKLADILEKYGFNKSAELIPQMATNGVNLDKLAEYTMRGPAGYSETKRAYFAEEKEKLNFGNTLLENGLSIEGLSRAMDPRHADSRTQRGHENTLLDLGISPKSVLESLKNEGRRGSLSIKTYVDDGLEMEQVIPFVDLTDYERWRSELPSMELPNDIELHILLDQTAIEQFKEKYELEKLRQPSKLNNAFDEFMLHLKEEKDQFGYLGYIDGAVEIARNSQDANNLLRYGADPDIVLNKLIDFADRNNSKLDHYVEFNELLDSYTRRGSGPIMPDSIVGKFSSEFIAKHFEELTNNNFGASANSIAEAANSLTVLDNIDNLYSRGADEEVLTSRVGEGVAETLYIIDNLINRDNMQPQVLTDAINNRLKQDGIASEEKEQFKNLLQNIINSIE